MHRISVTGQRKKACWSQQVYPLDADRFTIMDQDDCFILTFAQLYCLEGPDGAQINIRIRQNGADITDQQEPASN